MLKHVRSAYTQMYLVTPSVYEKLLKCLDEGDKRLIEGLNRPDVPPPRRPSEQILERVGRAEVVGEMERTAEPIVEYPPSEAESTFFSPTVTSTPVKMHRTRSFSSLPSLSQPSFVEPSAMVAGVPVEEMQAEIFGPPEVATGIIKKTRFQEPAPMQEPTAPISIEKILKLPRRERRFERSFEALEDVPLAQRYPGKIKKKFKPRLASVPEEVIESLQLAKKPSSQITEGPSMMEVVPEREISTPQLPHIQAPMIEQQISPSLAYQSRPQIQHVPQILVTPPVERRKPQLLAIEHGLSERTHVAARAPKICPAGEGPPSKQRIQCPICLRILSRTYGLQRHMKNVHGRDIEEYTPYIQKSYIPPLSFFDPSREIPFEMWRTQHPLSRPLPDPSTQMTFPLWRGLQPELEYEVVESEIIPSGSKRTLSEAKIKPTGYGPFKTFAVPKDDDDDDDESKKLEPEGSGKFSSWH